jgi:hypothetical protein
MLVIYYVVHKSLSDHIMHLSYKTSKAIRENKMCNIVVRESKPYLDLALLMLFGIGYIEFPAQFETLTLVHILFGNDY